MVCVKIVLLWKPILLKTSLTMATSVFCGNLLTLVLVTNVFVFFLFCVREPCCVLC